MDDAIYELNLVDGFESIASNDDGYARWPTVAVAGYEFIWADFAAMYYPLAQVGRHQAILAHLV